MMTNFIDKIAQGVSYNSEYVLGYSEDEIEKIERLYEIKIGGDLRRFFLEMGRSDGGLIVDDPIFLYNARIRIRTDIFMSNNKIQNGRQYQDFLYKYRMGLMLRLFFATSKCT